MDERKDAYQPLPPVQGRLDGGSLSAAVLKPGPSALIGWLLPRLLWTGIYAGVLLWFHFADVYHKHFAATGVLIAAYHLCRVLFIFYLFWIVHAAGTWLLRLVAGRAIAGLGVLDGLALGFFAGTGVWHLVMLALGYLNLYATGVAVALTLPVVALSYGHFSAALNALSRAAVERDAVARNLGGGVVTWLLILLAAQAFVMLLLVKGLYPGGGHDYFTHYAYYYQTVVERGGIWPNEVWYHYYYSKGAGLFFLAMLLTDPLAPQLVTFCFVVAAALALFLFLRRIAPGTQWPAVGAILFLAVHIFTTASTSMFRLHGGWGEFEKLHELVAALLIAILWASTGAIEQTGRMRLAWWVAAASAIVAAVIINSTIAAVIGGTFALMTIWLLAARQLVPAVMSASLGAVAAVALTSILAINYVTTGLANDQGIGIFWRFANVEALSRWGVLPDVILLYRDRTAAGAAEMRISSLDMARFAVESARVELLFPLIGCGVLIAIAARLRARLTCAAPLQAAAVIAALLVFLGLAVAAGRAQPISYYRYATFIVAIAIAAGVLAWSLAAQGIWLGWVARNKYVAVLVLLACLAVVRELTRPFTLLKHAAAFATGLYSVDKAYDTQFGPSPKTIWPATYKGARGAYEIVGPGTRIWSFHIHTYCMLPRCRVESYHSFMMTPQWDRVMFGPADEAKRILQDSGLNYFLFSAEADIFDPLPLSALFHPDHIAEHLGVRWTDGTTSLLTWLGPNTKPLDADWLAAYRRSVEKSGTVQGYPTEAMKAIFARLKETPHPWRSLQLPW